MSCEHKRKEFISSYYNDVEWCPDCGAVRGNNGLMGSRFQWLEWKVPEIVNEILCSCGHASKEHYRGIECCLICSCKSYQGL